MKLKDSELRVLQTVDSWGEYSCKKITEGRTPERADEFTKAMKVLLKRRYLLKVTSEDEEYLQVSEIGTVYLEGYDLGAEHWFTHFIALRRYLVRFAYWMRFEMKCPFSLRKELSGKLKNLILIIETTYFHADKHDEKTQALETRLRDSMGMKEVT